MGRYGWEVCGNKIAQRFQRQIRWTRRCASHLLGPAPKCHQDNEKVWIAVQGGHAQFFHRTRGADFCVKPLLMRIEETRPSQVRWLRRLEISRTTQWSVLKCTRPLWLVTLTIGKCFFCPFGRTSFAFDFGSCGLCARFSFYTRPFFSFPMLSFYGSCPLARF